MFDHLEIRTASGSYAPRDVGDLTLGDVLRLSGLPCSVFQAYVAADGNEATPIPLSVRYEDVREQEVILRCVRNIAYGDILPLTSRGALEWPTDAVTEAHRFTLESGRPCEDQVVEIGTQEARAIVTRAVHDFIHEDPVSGTVLAGISGGGDSNALVHALADAQATLGRPRRLVAYTIVFGNVFEESARDRAAALCQEHGIEHIVVDEEAATELLGVKHGLSEAFGEFFTRFGLRSWEPFGTFLIAQVAFALAAREQAEAFMLGYNREDVLAEFVFSLANGQRPLEFPSRAFGETRLLMPLWTVPKRILDACYPSYSIRNYNERWNTDPAPRSLGYHLAHALEDVYPNFGLTLLQGARSAFDDNWAAVERDDQSGFYMTEYTDPAALEDARLFARDFLFERG